MEVVIAMGILVMVAAGISQTILQTRGMAETNIREVTANAVVSGYMEQMKSMEYKHLLASIRDDSVPIPTVLNEGEEDPLYNGQWMEKEVVIDEPVDGGSKRKMDLLVKVELEDLAESGHEPAVTMELIYGWEDARSGQRRERALRSMRSYVPNF